MSSSNTNIVLISSDGESFELEEPVARKLKIISNMIDDDCADKPIPLQHIAGTILAIVIDYCQKLVEQDLKPKAVSEAEEVQKNPENCKDELKKLEIETLFQVILAANFLNIQSLLELISEIIAEYISPKSHEEVRQIFKIENDFTPEEEAELRNEDLWAFEGF